MAIIKYSGLVDQLRGRLNGTVFSRFNSGFNSYKKGQPSRWGSDTQQHMRQGFQQAARLWKQLSQSIKNNWQTIAAASPVKNRLGDDVTIPAYQYFLKCFQYARAANRTFVSNPATTLLKPIQADMLSAHLTTSYKNGRYVIDWLEIEAITIASAQSTGYVLVYLSQPIADNNSNYDSTYYVAGSQFIPTWFQPDDYIYIEVSEATMPEAWHTYDGAIHSVMIRPVTDLTAQSGTPIYSTVQSAYTPPVTHLPYTISLSQYSYGRAWLYLESSHPNPVFYDILAFGITETPITGSASDYRIITDIALTGQTSDIPNESLLNSGFKTTITTPAFNRLGNPRHIEIWPNAEMLPQLNAGPDITLPGYPPRITIRYRMKRLSDGLETIPALNTVTPNSPI